jgi:hypothetical protein
MLTLIGLFRECRRPLIKHVIMAYGVDIPTEVGYIYKKKIKESSSKSQFDGVPSVQKVIWEEPFGRLTEERVERERGGGLTEVLIRKKSKRLPLNGGDGKGTLQRSGDGTIPYLSLSWAHTWLLHATRAVRYGRNDWGNPRNPLDEIELSHRPKGATEWKSGPPPTNHTVDPKMFRVEPDSDTGTLHPHGTKYKPEMVRYHTVGKSRTTGIEYTTTVIEAIGVEHKETTRCVIPNQQAACCKSLHWDLRLTRLVLVPFLLTETTTFWLLVLRMCLNTCTMISVWSKVNVQCPA